MMRPGDKLASYRELARSLALLKDLPWRLVVAGDGPARAEVEQALAAAAPGRACFLGTLAQRRLGEVSPPSTLWLRSVARGVRHCAARTQSAGCGGSCARRASHVVMDGRTGLLAPAGDPEGLAQRIRSLLLDEGRRRALGAGAADFVVAERGLDGAARLLRGALAPLGAG